MSFDYREDVRSLLTELKDGIALVGSTLRGDTFLNSYNSLEHVSIVDFSKYDIEDTYPLTRFSNYKGADNSKLEDYSALVSGDGDGVASSMNREAVDSFVSNNHVVSFSLLASSFTDAFQYPIVRWDKDNRTGDIFLTSMMLNLKVKFAVPYSLSRADWLSNYEDITRSSVDINLNGRPFYEVLLEHCDVALDNFTRAVSKCYLVVRKKSLVTGIVENILVKPLHVGRALNYGSGYSSSSTSSNYLVNLNFRFDSIVSIDEGSDLQVFLCIPDFSSVNYTSSVGYFSSIINLSVDNVTRSGIDTTNDMSSYIDFIHFRKF